MSENNKKVYTDLDGFPWKDVSGLPQNPNKPGFPVRKKGNTQHKGLILLQDIPIPQQFMRDRETGQLFIVSKLGGSDNDKERYLLDPEFKAKTTLEMYYTVKPLMIKRAVINTTPTVEDCDFTQLNLGTQKVAYTLDVPKYAKYPVINVNFSPLPMWLSIDQLMGGQYCAISNFKEINDSLASDSSSLQIQLLNPLLLEPWTPSDSQRTYAATIGNFVYGSAACGLAKNKCLIADQSGLYSAKITDNKLTNIKLDFASNGIWNPMSLYIVYDTTDPINKAVVYMTALVSQYTKLPYMQNPGYSVTYYNGGSYTTDNAYQPVKNFVGRVVIFKFTVTSGVLDPKYSIVYSAFGTTAGSDPDFSQEVIRFYDTMEAPGGWSCNTPFCDDQNLHSTIILKGGNPPTRSPVVLDLGNFVFGVDSLFFRKDKNWQTLYKGTGLWYKKGEYPYVTVFSEDGNFIRNIPFFGDAFPVYAQRLRYVGNGSYAPLKFLIEPTEDIPTDTLTTSIPCEVTKCHFPRGMTAFPQFGFPSVGADGAFYLTKTWDSQPFYTGYLFHRNFYLAHGGVIDFGSCDIASMCTDDYSYSYDCYSTGITLAEICVVTNGSIYLNKGTMELGTRLTVKNWEKIECTTWNAGVSQSFAGYTATGGAGQSSETDIQLVTTYSGYMLRNYYPKTEKYYLLDAITSAHSMFDVSTLIIQGNRCLPDRFMINGTYKALNNPNNIIQGRMSDYRCFANFNGPTILTLGENPLIQKTSEGVMFSIKATDHHFLYTMAEMISSYTDYPVSGQKDITIKPNLNFSAYYFAKINGYNKITILSNSYTTKGMTLRQFLEQSSAPGISPAAGMTLDIDYITHMHNFIYLTSLDWALYPVVGQSGIYPQDREEYKGMKTLAGSYIYEGYSIKEGGSLEVLPGANLKDCWGGAVRLSTGYAVVNIKRNVDFKFTLRAMTNKTGYTPNQTFHYPNPAYTYDGIIAESFLVVY